MQDSPSEDLSYWIQCLEDPSIDEQVRAVIVLGMMGAEAQGTIPALVRALKTDEFQVQRLILASLSEIGAADPNDAPRLIELLNHPASRVRRRALVELSKIAWCLDEVLPELLECLQDFDQLMRRWAIYTLSVMGKKSANAVGALIPLLDEGDSLNRALTTVAIRSMGKSAIPALKQALQVGSRTKIRTFKQVSLHFKITKTKKSNDWCPRSNRSNPVDPRTFLFLSRLTPCLFR